MTFKTRYLAAAIAALALGAGAAAAQTPSLDGRWDATIAIGDTVIPFRLDLSTAGGAIVGTLFNGDETQTTTRASRQGEAVELEFGHYLTTIRASVGESGLSGRVDVRNGQPGGSPFRAVRHVPLPPVTGTVPSIAGTWHIPFEPGKETPKGEKAWRFIVKQQGADVSAAVLRIDGDTGALTGRYADGKFVVSHFDGSRPGLMEITPQPDGTLQIISRGSNRNGTLVAYRPDVARAKGLPEPADSTTHTSMRDPNEVFAFKFPDVNGRLVSNEDPRFKGKVIIAVVTGTWCPNCHDEAQYLVQLDKQYRNRGLEIVALDFEEPEQQDELSRVRSFVKKYGVEYTYLIAGAPIEMWEKVPQAVNLNTWPATFFIGRDGRVKRIHAGFAATASGEFNDALKREFTATIEELLREPVRTSVAGGQ
jgi:thiol-disulfide isomerase/thioredoxin